MLLVPPQADALRSEYGIVLCVLGIANSRSMLLQKLLPVDASTWQDELSLRARTQLQADHMNLASVRAR